MYPFPFLDNKPRPSDKHTHAEVAHYRWVE